MTVSSPFELSALSITALLNSMNRRNQRETSVRDYPPDGQGNKPPGPSQSTLLSMPTKGRSLSSDSLFSHESSANNLFPPLSPHSSIASSYCTAPEWPFSQTGSGYDTATGSPLVPSSASTVGIFEPASHAFHRENMDSSNTSDQERKSYSSIARSNPSTPEKKTEARPRVTLKSKSRKSGTGSSSDNQMETSRPATPTASQAQAVADELAKSTAVPASETSTRNEMKFSQSSSTGFASSDETDTTKFSWGDETCDYERALGETTQEVTDFTQSMNLGERVLTDSKPSTKVPPATVPSATIPSAELPVAPLLIQASPQKPSQVESYGPTHLEYPKKTIRKPTMEVAPGWVAATNARYLAEKKELEDDPRPTSLTGNGLLDILKASQKKKESDGAAEGKGQAVRTGAATTAKFHAKAGVPSPARLDLMRSLVQSAARDMSATKAGAAEREASIFTSQRIADFMAGKQISLESPTEASCKDTPNASTSSAVLSKPAIKFDHNHGSNCESWLTKYDEKAQKEEDKRPHYSTYMPRTQEKPWVKQWEAEAEAAAAGSTDDKQDTQDMTPNLRGGGFGDELAPISKKDDVDYSNKFYHESDTESGQQSSSDVRYERESNFESDTDIYPPFPPSSDDGYAGVYTDIDSSTQNISTRQLWIPSDSYTQSKSWVSEEEKMRVRYYKSLANLHYMSADGSPVLPQSFKEWIDLKADHAASKKRYSENQLRQHTNDMLVKRQVVADGEDPYQLHEGYDVTLSDKLRAIAKVDFHSSVLVHTSIWHENCTEASITDWPAYKEFKAEGDDRVKGGRGYRRLLPAPRRRKLDSQYMHLAEEPNGIAKEGPGVPMEYREIAWDLLVPAFDGIIKAEEMEFLSVRFFQHDKPFFAPAVEIFKDECHAGLKELIDEIEQED
ncbi:hypothetical protein BJ170DRAFT_477929 [Xylariales sp. AK1849]|nr:hypothetical protein BJ170DRAFT_477929 [Xylariales sp. AK1849]